VDRPILWQLEISHYNEKVRWALDYKQIPHVRRSLLPGIHRLKCLQLTKGQVKTTPVLTIGDESIGDSARIIAVLEERWPEPPLYPADPDERRRALELEEFFDKELGPDIRRALYHELLDRPELVLPLFLHGQTPAAQAMLRACFPVLRVAMRRDMNIYEEPAADSRDKMRAALSRLEEEIQPSGYLVGDSFSVADLSAAALFYPLAGPPPEYPYPTISGDEVPGTAQEFLAEVEGRAGVEWLKDMYRRHRRPGVPESYLSSAPAGSS
jgi:glutathione S-transferase